MVMQKTSITHCTWGWQERASHHGFSTQCFRFQHGRQTLLKGYDILKMASIEVSLALIVLS